MGLTASIGTPEAEAPIAGNTVHVDKNVLIIGRFRFSLEPEVANGFSLSALEAMASECGAPALIALSMTAFRTNNAAFMAHPKRTGASSPADRGWQEGSH